MKFLSRVLLWLATIWSAVWLGGQVFNALMVVPHFSRNPPDSLIAWGEMRFDNLADFFLIFSPLWTFILLLVCFFLSRGKLGRAWIIAAACAALASTGMLLWLVPMIAGLARSPGNDVPVIVARLHQWTTGNWIRIGIDFLTFLTAVRALTVSRRVLPRPLAMSETRLPVGERSI
ncbi:MAG TPA: hypothetical protein VN827_01870 [Chthoniobacterales bacterium]|jgi:cytosine/uracil/thiamine/allantoin permease|nr:hypothetical protein [Chthoniobacterales bacterium]